MSDIDQHIEKAEQMTGDASTKMLAATTILQEFGSNLNTIAQNPLMSGTIFISLSQKIKNHYISVLRESNDLTKKQVEYLEKITGQAANFARLGIAIGSVTQFVASMNHQLRETELQMGHFSNLGNLPGGVSNALSAAKYQGMYRGNLLSAYNSATAEQSIQAYQQMFGQMTANGLNPANMESLSTLAGVYQVGAGVNLASNVLNMQRAHGGFGTIRDVNKQFNIQRNIANLVYKRGGLLSFAGDQGNMGQSLGNINEIAMGLIGTPGIDNEEQAYAAAMRITGTLGNRGAGFGANIANNIIGGATDIINNPNKRFQAILTAQRYGVDTSNFSKSNRIDDLISMQQQVAKKLPTNRWDPESVAIMNTFGGMSGLGTGQQGRENIKAFANIKDYNKIQEDVNKALKDFSNGLKENPNIFKEYEKNLQENIQSTRGLKDKAAEIRQKISNSMPDAMRDASPIGLETIGTVTNAAVTAAQWYATWKLMGGKGAPGLGKIGPTISKGISAITGGGKTAAMLGAETTLAANGISATGTSTTATALGAGSISTIAAVAAGIAVPLLILHTAHGSDKTGEVRLRDRMTDLSSKPVKDKFLNLLAGQERSQSWLDNLNINKTDTTTFQKKSAIEGLGLDNAQKLNVDAMGNPLPTKDSEIDAAENRTVIDLNIRTDDGNVNKQTITGGRAAIDFFIATSSSVATASR
jgi:hypothetical protein